MKKAFAGLAAVVAFVLLVVAANAMTARLGLVLLPFGLAVTAGTFAAGVVLIVRDAVNDYAGRWAVAGCIAAGALASLWTSPAMLAVASAVAFAVAEGVDWAAYEPMRRRGWGRAVVVSSIAAAPIDTVIFLWLAPFPVTLSAVIGQTVVKVALALAAVALVKVVRGVVLRNRVEPVNS